MSGELVSIIEHGRGGNIARSWGQRFSRLIKRWVKSILKRFPGRLGAYAWQAEAEMLRQSGLFGVDHYLESNLDVAAAKVDPLLHYLRFGGREGRSPSKVFDSAFYLGSNPDVVAQGINPLLHYVLFGESEWRVPVPWFDRDFYLSWNPEARKNPRGVFADFVENYYPNVRSSLRDGQELAELVGSVNSEASACRELCGDLDGKPAVSIVIPVFNNLKMTLQCLVSVLKAGACVTFEVIVADDCSTDQTADVLPRLRKIRHIRQTNNGGFIASCNNGVQAARGDFLIFLNNDTHTMPRWLDELFDTFTIRPKAGLVGSQLIYPDGRLQEAGGVIWRDGTVWNYGRGGERRHHDFNYLRQVDYCSGASIMLRRSLFTDVGGFDALYAPAYAEDCDLAFKVRKAGYEVLYQPLSKVVHFEGVSSGTDVTSGVKSYQTQNLRKFYECWKNDLLDHRPTGELLELERDRGVHRRVLFIDACTPTPDSDAGSMVIFNFMKIFLGFGYGVSFIPADNMCNAGRYTADLQRLGVECLYWPYLRSVEGHLQRHGQNLDLIFLYRAPIADRFIDTVRAYAPKAKVIFNTVDLHFVREERQAKLTGSAACVKRAAELRTQELGVMKKADATILLNNKEVELVADLAPKVKTYMLPLTQDVPGCRVSFEDRRDFVFIGGFGHPPNLDAVKYFCQEVMPLVRQRLSGVKFVIVGSNPPAELAEIAAHDVEIRGFVPELASVFDHYRVSVAPLRFGAGMKGKIVSSLSFGVPCVTTSIGSEGMGLSPGENIFVADDAASFADALVQVYEDQGLWNSVSQAGVQFARENYSPQAVERKILTMLNEVGLPQ